MQDALVLRPGAAAARTVAAFVLIAVVVLVFLSVKWQLGGMLARLTKPEDENAAAIADTAIALAPGDPAASALRAAVGVDAISDDTRTSVEMAEHTVRLSPNDRRWRIALARSLADDGQPQRAEAEFRRAIDLAPNYADCHWYYANFLLRQGRRDDALEHFRLAAAGNWEYRQQVFSALWDIGGKDPALLRSVAGEGIENAAHLSLFFGSRGAAAHALSTWRTIPEAAREQYGPIAGVLAAGLFQQRHYPEALEFSREVGNDPAARLETVTNGSFENALDARTQGSNFSWKVARGDPKLDIALDNRVAQDGQRSLRLNFKGMSKPDFSNVEQTVAVVPNAHYRLSFWVRTENLKAAAGPLIDVLNTGVIASLAHSESIENGTAGWRQLDLDFATPADCEGVIIRMIRSSCGGDDCAITGSVWLDGFTLARTR